MRTVWIAIMVAACSSSSGSTTETTTPTPMNGGAVNASMTTEPPQQPPAQPAQPTNPDAAFDATMAQVLVVFAALGAAVDRAGNDCPAAAAGLDAVLDDPRNQQVVAANQALSEDVAMCGRIEAWTKAHMDELVEVMTKIQSAGARCKDDQAFQAFLVRFQAL